MLHFTRLFDTAFRISVLFLSLILMAFLMIVGAKTAFAATLHSQNVILTTDSLTVGDLFDNVGRSADYVLGPAPQPGKDMVLNAPTLMRIAMALDLSWSPQSSSDQVIVSRAATLVPAHQVKESLISALREKGLNNNFTVDTGATSLEMILPHDQLATVEITNLNYNPRTARFDATISAPSAAKPTRQIAISGSVIGIMSLPVLKTSLRNGDIIGESDIDQIEVYESDIQPDMLLSAENMIGMTPLRMVIAGKPIRTVDLQSPQLVERGKSVTITFSEGPLKLTALGKALQNGAKGDMIRVVNNTSNRSIDAVVNGFGEVIVRQ